MTVDRTAPGDQVHLLALTEVLYRCGWITPSVTVSTIHLVTMNGLYPRAVGPRLKLSPLAVSLSLLFWAWIWGARIMPLCVNPSLASI